MAKMVKAVEKEVAEMEGNEGERERKRKTMKKKSRLDTGLSTIRSAAKVLC